MRIVTHYSHLNGLEHILVHQRSLWSEIQDVIAGVNAEKCRTRISKELRKKGKYLYAPKALNAAFLSRFQKLNWKPSKTSYWVTHDARLIRKTLHMTPAEQKKEIQGAGQIPIYSYNQTDFVKNRIAVEIQFGKYAFVAYDLFVKHLAFYVGDQIEVGVEVLPRKSLQAEMSSGVAYYEGELYNVIREGRGNPPVPLVIIGVAP